MAGLLNSLVQQVTESGTTMSAISSNDDEEEKKSLANTSSNESSSCTERFQQTNGYATDSNGPSNVSLQGSHGAAGDEALCKQEGTTGDSDVATTSRPLSSHPVGAPKDDNAELKKDVSPTTAGGSEAKPLPPANTPVSGRAGPTRPVQGAPTVNIDWISKMSAEAVLQTYDVPREELQFQEKIGVGTTAYVFKGKWNKQSVAIKKLKLSLNGALQLRKETAFLREAAIAIQLSHEHLVRLYGIAFDEQPYLLISEFCRGGSCYVLIYKTDLDLVLHQQLKMCCDIANAMDYLHSFRPMVLHRDLKSLNLLLDEAVTCEEDIPNVKVADFGLSKMNDNPDGWGIMTKEAGTAHWMAPEAYYPNYTEKVDVYSYAMVMFEIACEEIPFEGMDPLSVKKEVLAGGRPDMEAVPPFMPNDFVTLMEDCWSHEPSARPTFGHICKCLSKIVSEEL